LLARELDYGSVASQVIGREAQRVAVLLERRFDHTAGSLKLRRRVLEGIAALGAGREHHFWVVLMEGKMTS